MWVLYVKDLHYDVVILGTKFSALRSVKTRMYAESTWRRDAAGISVTFLSLNEVHFFFTVSPWTYFALRWWEHFTSSLIQWTAMMPMHSRLMGPSCREEGVESGDLLCLHFILGFINIMIKICCYLICCDPPDFPRCIIIITWLIITSKPKNKVKCMLIAVMWPQKSSSITVERLVQIFQDT